MVWSEATSDGDDDDRADPFDRFSSAQLYTRAQVLSSPCPIPLAPGIYGWWFNELPVAMDTRGCLTRNGCTLLYTGIGPKKPSPNLQRQSG